MPGQMYFIIIARRFYIARKNVTGRTASTYEGKRRAAVDKYRGSS